MESNLGIEIEMGMDMKKELYSNRQFEQWFNVANRNVFFEFINNNTQYPIWG